MYRLSLPSRNIGRFEEISLVAVPAKEEKSTSEGEANNGDKHPVASKLLYLLEQSSKAYMFSTYPENQLHVVAVPAITQMVRKEAPRVVVVLVREQNPDAAAIGLVSNIESIITVVTPDDAQEQRSCTRHDCDVGQQPAPIVVCQLVNYALEERVMRQSTHSIIADSRRHRLPYKRGIFQERLQIPIASIVQINVYATIVVQHKVPNRIRSLNGVRIVLEGLQELGVLRSDELHRHSIRPQLVLPFRIFV